MVPISACIRVADGPPLGLLTKVVPRPGPGNSLRVCQVDCSTHNPKTLGLRRPGGRPGRKTTIDVYNQLGSECCTTPSRLMYCVCNVQHGKAMQAPAPEPEGGRGVDAAGRGEPRRQTMMAGGLIFSALTARSEGRLGEEPQVASRCPLGGSSLLRCHDRYFAR